MIVVKDAGIIKVENNRSVFYHANTQWEKGEPIAISTEEVQGQEFINDNGERVVIGMTQVVQDAIGLPMETFENMNRTLRGQSWDLKRAREQFEDLRQALASMNFWGRLHFLFLGKRYYD